MADPPPSRPFSFAMRLQEIEQVRSVFVDWQGRIEQVASGRFEGSLQVVSGPLLRIIEIEGNPRVRVCGRDSSGLVSVYPVIPEFASGLWQGRRLDPGQLVFHSTDVEVDHTSGRSGGVRGLALHPDALEAAVRAVLSTDDAGLPKTWATFVPSPDAFQQFNSRLVQLRDLAVADPSSLVTPERRQQEQECVRTLVTALFSAGAPRPDLPFSARSLLVRRAEDLMRSSLGGALGSIDLCRELGVSDRTLRLAFQERYGLGPMTYYKSLRLNAVRFRLRAEPIVTVAAAAREYGFHHLGNFAADFRRLFGMRPSEMDRRS